MKRSQDEFVAARRADWDELERLLDEKRGWHKLPPRSISRAAALYRAVCADRMRAQAAGFAGELLTLLDGLAARGHNALYSAPPYRLGAVWELLRGDFPRALRRHARLFWLALALFLLPGLAGFGLSYQSRSFALGLLSPAQAEAMEKMYDKELAGRSEAQDTGMAGFYVYNNVGIAFRCFATGVLFGLGSVFFLVYNGLQMGAVAGLLTASGRGLNLLTFVATHGAFELTAIVIAGAAGMVMGYALIDTRGRRRFASLRTKARDIVQMVMGAALMLMAAALIEAFWSPSALPGAVKLSVALVLYILVTVYLVFAGRGPSSGDAGGSGDRPL